MTQEQQIQQLLKETPELSIADLAERSGIRRPNIRRILGQGAKAGVFTRVAKGTYTLFEEGQQVLWIECGDCRDILKEMAESGYKFDMIFLDIPYYSRELVGSNRLKKEDWYDFLTPRDLYRLLESITQMTNGLATAIFLMLSGAKSAQKDMGTYLDAARLNGLQIAQEGGYTKTYRNGQPVMNIRGEVSAPERIYLLNKTGSPLQTSLDFVLPRPNGYPTEKPEELLEGLILPSTAVGDHVLDPCAGSGKIGKVGRRLQRRVTLIEKNPQAIIEHIVPNLSSTKFF